MVAQAPGRADDDMDARLQGAALALRVHAADAGANARAGVAIEPGQFAFDLQRQLAGRRDDEGERRVGRRQSWRVAEQRLRHRDAIGDGLAGAGLGRNQKISPRSLRRGDGNLNRRWLQIAAFLQREGEGRIRCE